MSNRLLIVDDQRGIATVVGQIAETLGFEVRIMTSSVDATEVFLEFRPNIVFLDMIMPTKDGIDVLNEILLTDIPTRIILASGAGEAYLKLGKGVAHLHGNDQVLLLRKPFRRAELIAALTREQAATDTPSDPPDGARQS